MPTKYTTTEYLGFLDDVASYVSPGEQPALQAISRWVSRNSNNSASCSGMASVSTTETPTNHTSMIKNTTPTTEPSKPSDSRDEIDLLFFGPESGTETKDSAQNAKGHRKRARSEDEDPKPKRQKKNPNEPEPKIEMPKKKIGWRAAEDQAYHRSAKERATKQEKWADKISRVKNAYAKTIVENAFATETPASWRGKMFAERPAVVEKKVMLKPLIPLGDANDSAKRVTGNLGQPIIGRGSKTKAANRTAEKIEQRFRTYRNDALRYAKLLSKIEGFESWGSKKKLAVRSLIMDNIEARRSEELKELGHLN